MCDQEPTFSVEFPLLGVKPTKCAMRWPTALCQKQTFGGLVAFDRLPTLAVIRSLRHIGIVTKSASPRRRSKLCEYLHMKRRGWLRWQSGYH